MTRDLCNLNLLAKLMVSLHQILFNLAVAAIAEAVLLRISAEQVPSLHRIAPRYLKLATYSNFWPGSRKSGFKERVVSHRGGLSSGIPLCSRHAWDRLVHDLH